MIYHNQYTLTIGQYEIMELTGDRNVLCKLPIKMPKKWLDKAHKRLMVDYNKQANADKINELIEKDSEKLYVYNQLYLLEILERLIKISGVNGDVSKELKEIYKHKYNKEPETKEDFEKPFKEKERLSTKAKQYFDENTEENKIDIELLLINLQMILNIDNIREHKFYLLGLYIKKAAEINKPK